MTGSPVGWTASPPRAQVIHIDIDAAEVGKNRVPDVPVVSDVRLALEALLQASVGEGSNRRTDAWLERIDTWKHHYPLVIPQPTGEIAPQEVVIALRELAPEAFFTTDVGQHQMWAAQFLRTDPDAGSAAPAWAPWASACPPPWGSKPPSPTSG